MRRTTGALGRPAPRQLTGGQHPLAVVRELPGEFVGALVVAALLRAFVGVLPDLSTGHRSASRLPLTLRD